MILPIRHDEYDGQAVPRQQISGFRLASGKELQARIKQWRFEAKTMRVALLVHRSSRQGARAEFCSSTRI